MFKMYEVSHCTISLFIPVLLPSRPCSSLFFAHLCCTVLSIHYSSAFSSSDEANTPLLGRSPLQTRRRTTSPARRSHRVGSVQCKRIRNPLQCAFFHAHGTTVHLVSHSSPHLYFALQRVPFWRNGCTMGIIDDGYAWSSSDRCTLGVDCETGCYAANRSTLGIGPDVYILTCGSLERTWNELDPSLGRTRDELDTALRWTWNPSLIRTWDKSSGCGQI